jgi:hypothetical protein
VDGDRPWRGSVEEVGSGNFHILAEPVILYHSIYQFSGRQRLSRRQIPG